MMAENSHLISKMPERETGLPNTYTEGNALPNPSMLFSPFWVKGSSLG